MRSLLLAIALVPALALPSAAQEGTPAALLALADEILHQVSDLRGLPLLGPVRRQVHDEATLRSYIAERLREEYPGDRLRREERLLAALGLLPPGCDLEKAIGDLYAAQTAGYYDPRRRTLYLSERLPEPMQRPTLAHELTHALQDQHFRIQRFLEPSAGDPDDDARLASLALVEGDATAVMLASLAPAGAAGSWTEALPLFEGGLLEALAAAQSPSIPPFLVQVLNFPYRHGTAFVAALYTAGGWRAVNDAFARLPRSSEQVLHPARYAAAGDEPTPVGRGPFPERLAGLERHYDLVLGEFVTRLVLEAEAGAEAAARAAEGWDGDRAALYVGNGTELVLWLSVWDSPEEAAEFAETARAGRGGGRVIEKRGERVIHLRSTGALEPEHLLDLANGIWPGWR